MIEPFTNDWTLRAEDRHKFLEQLAREGPGGDAKPKEAIPLEINDLFADTHRHTPQEVRAGLQEECDEKAPGTVVVSDLREHRGERRMPTGEGAQPAPEGAAGGQPQNDQGKDQAPGTGTATSSTEAQARPKSIHAAMLGPMELAEAEGTQEQPRVSARGEKVGSRQHTGNVEAFG
eukprot:CAMPEP_0168428240 /NCGR_PEP_ID=MMETSP0228-20121227/36757_1 /TAXON_ID=133427 /ORGANISM="Protoceratium reticulatum, Strain CCCM 535 (=CCMP 1889)" /LENGTH=175 /DNA_ID=CAMNT_0008442297 /DNA_START=1 /DNA_END=524 /DNA_ORIENTATION=-